MAPYPSVLVSCPNYGTCVIEKMHVAHSMKYKNDSDMMFENIISMLIDNVRHVIYFDSFLLRMKFMFVSKTHMPFCDVEK